MNTKQRNTWWELVHQCEIQCTRQPYNSINVASYTRSSAIVAAGDLVEIITPELAELLERLSIWITADAWTRHTDLKQVLAGLEADCTQARALAARIHEALEATE